MSQLRRSLIAWAAILVLVSLVAGYAYYKQATTHANVDVIDYYSNRDGGFVAIGYTSKQPGFLLMSVIDPDEVTINARQISIAATGTHTMVTVKTGSAETEMELSKPALFLIDEIGKIESTRVSWTHKDFIDMLHAVDCKINGSARCESPFADLADLMQNWPRTQSTDRAEAFLVQRLQHRR